MEKNCNIFCVTYEDNTKDNLMVFGEEIDKKEMKHHIFQHLKETNGEVYDNDELKEAADNIIHGCTWYNGGDEYYLETSTLFE